MALESSATKSLPIILLPLASENLAQYLIVSTLEREYRGTWMMLMQGIYKEVPINKTFGYQKQSWRGGRSEKNNLIHIRQMIGHFMKKSQRVKLQSFVINFPS